MQEVFEKIVEKLEVAGKTELIAHGGRRNGKTLALGYAKGISEAIEIVKQAAAECKHGHFGCNSNGQHEKCYLCCDYDCKNRNREWFGAKDDNNDWIPCSERLPEKYNCVLAYTDAGGYYIAHVNGCGKFVCTAECVSTVIENSDVIAWQPLPAPYQPKGECEAYGI